MLIRAFAVVACASVLSSCACQGTDSSGGAPKRADLSSPTLVGAWEVTASRARGVGKNLLTFSSDGTFFRSGDTHPVLSGAHGAWKLVGPDGNEFKGTVKSSNRDLQDNEISTGSSPLAGRRIQVQPF